MLENAKIAVEIAAGMGCRLDYSKKSVASLERLAGFYHMAFKMGFVQKNDAIMMASGLGAYLGEVLLRNGLKDLGFTWIDKENECLISNGEDIMAPITKVYKRITAGPYHDLTDFYEVVLGLAKGELDPMTDQRIHILHDDVVQ